LLIGIAQASTVAPRSARSNVEEDSDPVPAAGGSLLDELVRDGVPAITGGS
jgi:hypothetical protein